MTFHDFIGHEDAKRALILNAIDPRCGGVLFIGEKGCGKSTLARLYRRLLPEETPFVNLPLNITQDALLGAVDMEATLRAGRKVLQRSLLKRADGGILYIDDVNLLAPEIMALVREGQHPPKAAEIEEDLAANGCPEFILLGSMNPEEGPLSPHVLDRFGMCVLWEGLKDAEQKMAVMKRALSGADAASVAHRSTKGRQADLPSPDEKLKTEIRESRQVLNHVFVPPEIYDYLAQLCVENDVGSHRGDLFLFAAARAYAAFRRDKAVTKEHCDTVLPLVLLHRKKILQEMEEQHRQADAHREDPEKGKEEPEKEQPRDAESSAEKSDAPEDKTPEKPDDSHETKRESRDAEETFAVGEAFKVRRLFFRKDRMNRDLSGRRTKTGSRTHRGRHIKNILRENGDIAIDATIRAAAPFQTVRGRTDLMLIRREDFRFKQRERKMGHFVVFVVDGSGSMGAKRRMVETKGAIMSLLIDCYQKRDSVSMIVFRKDKAEVVLQPTSSVQAAAKRLSDIPVGGKTPLTAGLVEAFKLIKRIRMKSFEMRCLVVLITDGRANHSLSRAPVREEIPKAARLLGTLPFCDFVVVDTEDKGRFIKTDLARDVATFLGADYFLIETLKTDHLTGIVQTKKAAFLQS
ncbi:MAG: VWA domain-containing protein [Deltaproteobacteria bacterium]|nr:VWA domain-containing protein [Deltaproteobacteria bacterium]